MENFYNKPPLTKTQLHTFYEKEGNNGAKTGLYVVKYNDYVRVEKRNTFLNKEGKERMKLKTLDMHDVNHIHDNIELIYDFHCKFENPSADKYRQKEIIPQEKTNAPPKDKKEEPKIPKDDGIPF